MKRKPSGRTLCNVAKKFFSPNHEHINQIEMFKPRYRPTSPNWGGKREGSGRKKSTVRISVPVDCLPEIQQIISNYKNLKSVTEIKRESE